MNPYAFTSKPRGERASAQRKKLPLNPVIRAVGVSLLERGVVDLALRIANDNDALLNVARRLEGREGLEVHELRALASEGAVLARGRVYDATTHKPRTWRLRILLLNSKQRGGGAPMSAPRKPSSTKELGVEHRDEVSDSESPHRADDAGAPLRRTTQLEMLPSVAIQEDGPTAAPTSIGDAIAMVVDGAQVADDAAPAPPDPAPDIEQPSGSSGSRGSSSPAGPAGPAGVAPPSRQPQSPDAWFAPPDAPEARVAPIPVTLLLLRARLESERQRDPMDRALVDLVLAGEPFATGDARESTLNAVMRIAARAAQNSPSEVLVELVEPSLLRMTEVEPENAITAEQALNAAEAALQGARRTFARALDRGDDAELAQIVVAPLAPHLVHDQGDLYRYDGETGLWQALDTGSLSRLIQSYSGAPVRAGGRVGSELRVNSGKVRGVTQLIRDRVSRPNFFAEAPPGFPFANGWVTADERGIHVGPLLPQHRARAKMAFPFGADARADRFHAYLDQVFAGDTDKQQKVTFLQEFLGACLVGQATRFQKAVVLFGCAGRNGKSTLIDVVSELFPPEARQSIAPQTLGNEYYRMKLKGVRLNAVAELPRGPIFASEPLKAVIAGDAIMGRAIGRNPLRFRPIAGHIFAANKLPDVSDDSPAFWSRFVIISFNRSFDDAEQDKDLARTIIETELPGVALFALQGAVRLAAQGARGQFTLPSSHHQLLDEWRSSGDTVARFVQEALVVTTGTAERTRFQPLYDCYKAWAIQNRTQPIAANKFGERLKSLGHRPVKPGDFVLYNLRPVGASTTSA